jgi:hypothetical protein
VYIAGLLQNPSIDAILSMLDDDEDDEESDDEELAAGECN